VNPWQKKVGSRQLAKKGVRSEVEMGRWGDGVMGDPSLIRASVAKKRCE